jgi:hypothetical protein
MNYCPGTSKVPSKRHDRTLTLQKLFMEIDTRVNDLVGSHTVRMEPRHLTRLRDIISHAGTSSPLSVMAVGRVGYGNAINNGSLGISYAADEQLPVRIEIATRLNG